MSSIRGIRMNRTALGILHGLRHRGAWAGPRNGAARGCTVECTQEPSYRDDFLSDEVHQATGMISVQADCGIREAFGRLCIRAQALGQTVQVSAVDVLDRVLSFDV